MLSLPCFSSEHLNSSNIESISLVGNIHRRRWRWNPFERELDMVHVSPTRWQITLPVDGPQLPEVSGCYSIRFVVNHSPRRQLKTAIGANTQASLKWTLRETEDGTATTNIHFRSDQCQSILFEIDVETMQLTLSPSAGEDSVKRIDRFTSFQLNGFVWDSLSMFEKFDPRLKGREFIRKTDQLWTLEVPLLANGGIDFRADGVYQFLISADHDEDFGFASINDGLGTLVQGTGFGSSHGTSMHSGCTVKINQDGIYRFNLHDPFSKRPTVSVQSVSDTIAPLDEPKLLNNRTSFQLLGSIFDDNQFDPTDPSRMMHPLAGTDQVGLTCKVKAGFHVVNVGISTELFLDTMGLGCWLNSCYEESGSQSIQCMTWHGKPHELNICFELNKDAHLEFAFDPATDILTIDVLEDDARLKPVSSIDSLSLVGNFESPLEQWDPQSPANLMNPIGPGRFERVIQLQSGITYNYKYVANCSPWALVYADYELDCNGYDFTGINPNFSDPTKRDLKRFGQLTSHGNPPALEFTPTHTGAYRFYADLVLGGYSVKPFTSI